MIPFYNALRIAGADAGPKGQQLITESAPFTVPDGVFLISVVAIGRGRAASGTRGGTGGALAYVNNVVVTPGQVLEAVINATVSSLSSGSVLVAANAGQNTAAGQVIAGTGFPGGGPPDGGAGSTGLARNGAGAGGYTSAGETAGSYDTSAGFGGGGSSPYGGGGGGAQGASPNVNGGTYGGGGGKFYLNGGVLQAGAGGPGCVRIIWGEGRAFPNTNTGDV